MQILLFHLLFYVGVFSGLYLLFKKANIERPWRAFVPVLNLFIIRRLQGKNPYWALLQVLPFFGIFFTTVYSISFIQLFGKTKWSQHLAVAFFGFVVLIYFGKQPTTQFLGKDFLKNQPKRPWRSLAYDFFYAVILVYLVNLFILQSYVIPSPSMEDALLVGDQLFVTKFDYGLRLPNTVLSLPLMHNTMFFTESTPSYSRLIEFPYTRWGTMDVERGDVVVFNFPMDDTAIDLPGYRSERTYYEECRLVGREYILAHPETYPLMYRPTDKKENFIKRAVGISGDKIEVVNAQLFVNGQKTTYENEKYSYLITTDGSSLNFDLLKEETGIDWNKFRRNESGTMFSAFLTNAQKEKIEKVAGVRAVEMLSETWAERADARNPLAFSSRCFPYDTTRFKWTRDNYGPIWIPKKGDRIALNDSTWTIYGRCISTYEHHQVEIKEGQFFIDGTLAKDYVFDFNYYWLMGDNRHNSLDSRFWGFVPEDHVIGKAFVIWFSKSEEGLRWGRFFNLIK